LKLELPLLALAPAKVNLCLYVGPTRSDGMHEICSLIQSVALADEVTLEHAKRASDEVVTPGVSGPNLAADALAGFRERFRWEEGPIRISIEKKIPIAAGLGGGSADAAAVLRLAAAASGIQPPPAELVRLAMAIGADVPSQLAPGLSLVTGAGEQVVPLEQPVQMGIVILGPEQGLSTKDVYARADQLGLPRPDLDHVRSAVEQADVPAVLPALLHNDLQPATLDLAPSAARALDLLAESGAAGTLVSGSGPSAFGVYENAAEAKRGAAWLHERWGGGVFAAAAVDRSFGEPRP
jgi:4-diphosphocytidyl-2-C-methyl-D-erythritol kinase